LVLNTGTKGEKKSFFVGKVGWFLKLFKAISIFVIFTALKVLDRFH
jgi:hypothetical protein